jgi:pyrimidine deaminase RibD-like protein
MPLTETEAKMMNLVVGKFIKSKETTKRKDLVTRFKSYEAIDRLISSGALRNFDNDGSELIPTVLGVECSGDADSVKQARSSLELVLQALQNLYEVTPARQQIYRNDVLKSVNQIQEDTIPEVVDCGLYFAKEFPAFDSYGPSPGQPRPTPFNLEWMLISERIVPLNVKSAWDEHIRDCKAVLKTITQAADEGVSQSSSDSVDREFALMAIEEARKSVSEDDGRVHPKVGVVVVKNGRVLSKAHRGEELGNHAEYVALEKKLEDVSLIGATVYTTLEPCTSRNHPKVACAYRLTERKVGRVMIGMLDPDDRISGRGQRMLRKAGIATELFPHDLMTEVEELNREFMRDRESAEGHVPASPKTSAPPKLRVVLESGHVSNFLLKFFNDDEGPIFVRSVRLFANKIELTDPLIPADPSTWKVLPHTSISLGKSIVHQRNPAVSLMTMNSHKGLFFQTPMDVVVSCEMNGQLCDVSQTLYVKVNCASNLIVPLV